jgi:hypothetical protein
VNPLVEPAEGVPPVKAIPTYSSPEEVADSDGRAIEVDEDEGF